MNHVFYVMSPLFVIILIGILARQIWLKSEDFWINLQKLSYYLIFPCLIFNSTAHVNLKTVSIKNLAAGLTIATLLMALGLIIAQRVFNINRAVFTSIFQGAMRYNSYIFLGLGKIIFGDQGIVIVAVLSAYMITLTNILAISSFAVYIPSKEENHNSMRLIFSTVLTNPLVMANVAGFIFNLLGLNLHPGIKSSITHIANAAFAIGMLNIGAALKFDFNLSNMKPVAFTVVVKLLIFPIITYLVFSVIQVSALEKAIAMLYSCSPSGGSTLVVVSRQLNGDPDSMLKIVTLITVFSLVSLSIFVYIFNL